jgi:cytidylate kinase
MATITISRQFGAGGRTLGEKLAQRLGYYYADDVMVKEVAQRMNVSSKAVRGFEKEGASNLMKILDKFISKDYIDRLISDKYGHVYEKKYVESVRSIVRGLHEQGNVVIVGRGSQYILQDEKNVIHVLLVKELDDRVRFITENYMMRNEEEVRKIINRADKIRENFLSFFSNNESHDSPLLYDLTLNMNRINMDLAQKLVVDLISE